MRIFTAICLCMALVACQQTQDSASNLYGTAGDEAGKSYNKIGELVGLKKPTPPPTGKAQTRYCYKTYNDIVCYSRPIPGEEYRLVGFQEANGKTGYVIEPGVTGTGANAVKPSPVKPATVGPQPLKSVTVGPPPPVKGTDDQKQLKEVIFDPAELEPKELVPEKPQ